MMVRSDETAKCCRTRDTKKNVLLNSGKISYPAKLSTSLSTSQPQTKQPTTHHSLAEVRQQLSRNGSSNPIQRHTDFRHASGVESYLDLSPGWSWVDEAGVPLLVPGCMKPPKLNE